MASGKVLIVGVGNIGLQLIKNLSRDFSLVCIDSSEPALEGARRLRGEDLTTIVGDATSRLVLEEAGAADADTVIISTTTEKVNIEIARILKDHFTVPRVISIGITQKGIATLDELGVEVESIFNVSATGIRNRLEAKTKTVHGIGLGKNEILEVEVHANSRLANKRLAALRPQNWRVGVIYREGNILVPHSETSLRAKDKVIILGQPLVLKTVAEMLTFRFTHFPLEYGDTLIAYFPARWQPAYLDEVEYICSVYPLEKALFVCVRKSSELEDRLRAIVARHHFKQYDIEETNGQPAFAGLRALLQEYGRRAAMMTLPRSSIEFSGLPLIGARRGKHLLITLSAALGCPILLAGGTFPYEKVAVPCLDLGSLKRSMEATLEMSAGISYDIEALFVSLSRYISSEEQAREFEEMKKAVADLGLIYKAGIETTELRGNPIKVVRQAMEERNLMVADIAGWRDIGFFASLLTPDVAWSIVRQSPASTLLIPPVDLLA